MGDILLAEQGTPTTPASGEGILFFDNSASLFLQKNDGGVVQGDSIRASTAQQSGFSSDTYVTNSGLIIPSISMQAGMFWEWLIPATRSGAGTAAPVFQVRIGSAQTTADTSRLSITTAAQTGVSDTGLIHIMVTCRTVAVGGVIQGFVWIQHNLAATGFANTPAGFNLVQGTSGAFDNTALGGQFIGLSINAGASATWTFEQVIGRVFYG